MPQLWGSVQSKLTLVLYFLNFFFIFNSLGPCEVSTHPIKGLVPISWEEGEGWGARLLQPRAICQLGDGDLFFLIN